MYLVLKSHSEVSEVTKAAEKEGYVNAMDSYVTEKIQHS